MINIPTELLRTLITVVDLRSFTKAAQSLGVTQPAVSAQIKRLQFLLDSELLDKSAPGVSLTPSGEIVTNYARRLLAINDQIVDLAAPRVLGQTLHVGMTGDFAGVALAKAAAQFRNVRPEFRFVFHAEAPDSLLHRLREGELDALLMVTASGPILDARYAWSEKLTWAGIAAQANGPAKPVQLISYGEECPFQRAAIGALNEAGLDHEMVTIASNATSLCSAVAAGLGVTVLPRSRVCDFPTLVAYERPHWPSLPDIFLGLYLREGAGGEVREQLAERILAVWQEGASTVEAGMRRDQTQNPQVAVG